jgi:phospholipid-binding lipoprotein MlaA
MTIRKAPLSLCAALLLLVSGCATMPDNAGTNDPYEKTNRAVFEFNKQLDENIALPIAQFYRDVVPEPLRIGIHNFLVNIRLPITFGNDLLQGHVTRGAQTVGRFAVNSVLGIGGVLDVATLWEMPNHTEDFGQTLGTYGAGEGFYIVLPILGPAPPRDLFGRIVDTFMDPFTYIDFRGETDWMIGRGAVEVLDLRERNIETIEDIQQTSIDYYATVRNLYRQNRNAEIHDDTETPEDLPDF